MQVKNIVSHWFRSDEDQQLFSGQQTLSFELIENGVG